MWGRDLTLLSCRRRAESRSPDRHHHLQTHPDKDVASPARTKARRPRRQDPHSTDSKAEAPPRESSEMLACTEMITMCLQSAKHEHLRKQQQHEHNQNQNQGFSLVQDVSPLFKSLMEVVLFIYLFYLIVSAFSHLWVVCCILQSVNSWWMLTYAAQLCKIGQVVSISVWRKERSGHGADVPLTSITYAADALACASWGFSTRVVTSVMEPVSPGVVSSGFRRTRAERFWCPGTAVCGPSALRGH